MMEPKLTRQKERICIITGASSGLGEEFAKQLGDRKSTESLSIDSIWLIARRKDKLTQLASFLMTQNPALKRVEVIPLDLTLPESADVVLEKLNELVPVVQPEITWLICNAGFGAVGEFSQITPNTYRAMSEVNMLSPILMIHALEKFYGQECHILPVASSAGFSPIPFFSFYAATKSFLIHICLAVSHEWKNKKRHFTIVVPGPVKTDFFIAARPVSEAGSKPLAAPFFATSPHGVVKKALRDAKKKRRYSYDSLWIRLLCLIGNITPVGITLQLMANFKQQLRN